MRVLPASKMNKKAAMYLLSAKMIKRVDVSSFQKNAAIGSISKKLYAAI